MVQQPQLRIVGQVALRLLLLLLPLCVLTNIRPLSS